MEFYTLRTKDGLMLTNIPNDVPADSPVLKERILRLRAASGLPSLDVNQSPSSAAAELMKRQGYVATESFLPPEAMQQPETPERMPAASKSEKPKSETTAGGLASAAARGLGATLLGGAGGALVGGLAGIPAGPPGILAGAALGAKTGASVTGGADLILNIAKAVTGMDFATPGDAARAFFNTIGAPEPDTQAEMLLQTLTEGAAGGYGGASAAGAVASALPAGTRAARIASTMAEGPGTQAAMGATGAVGGETARLFAESKGAGPEAQLAATLAGDIAASGLGPAALRRIPGIAGGMTMVPAAQSARRAEQAADIAAAERSGFALTTSDVFPPKTSAGQALQQTTEAIPLVGTGGLRKEQQAKRASAAEKFLLDLGAVPDADPVAFKVAEDLISTRKARVNQLVKKKSDVLDEVEGAGPVDVSRIENEIVQQVSELSKLPGNEFKVAASFLEEMFDKVRGQPISIIEDQRKVLGNRLQGPEFARVKDQIGKAFNAVYASLNKDMADHIQKNATDPNAVSNWRNANRELAVLYGQFRKSVGGKKLQDAVNAGGERISDITSILKDQDPTVISKLNDNLSQQGQANLRALIVSKVAMESGGLGSIEPNKFLTSVQKYAKQFGVTLPKDKMNELRNFQRALTVSARADEAVKGPKTGYRVLPLVAAALSGISAGPAVTILGGLSLGKVANVIESPAVRNLLLKFPEMKPGSPQEFELAKRVVAAIGDVTREQEQQQQAYTQ